MQLKNPMAYTISDLQRDNAKLKADLEAHKAQLEAIKATVESTNRLVIGNGRELFERLDALVLAQPDPGRGDRLYTKDDLADRWGVGKRTVDTIVSEEDIEITYIRQTIPRFTHEAVKAFELSKTGRMRRRAGERMRKK